MFPGVLLFSLFWFLIKYFSLDYSDQFVVEWYENDGRDSWTT